MNLSYNHGRSEKGRCVFPVPSAVPDNPGSLHDAKNSASYFYCRVWFTYSCSQSFSYFWGSYLIPGAQNLKKVFVVLIQQCCSWSEWLYFECSAIPGMTRYNLYNQCIFSRPSLDWCNCDSRLWEMESTSNIKILDPLPIHTSSSFLAGCTSLFQLFIRGLSSSNFVWEGPANKQGDFC